MYIDLKVNEWKEVYCIIKGKQFIAYEKRIDNDPSNKSLHNGEIFLEVPIKFNQ